MQKWGDRAADARTDIRWRLWLNSNKISAAAIVYSKASGDRECKITLENDTCYCIMVKDFSVVSSACGIGFTMSPWGIHWIYLNSDYITVETDDNFTFTFTTIVGYNIYAMAIKIQV